MNVLQPVDSNERFRRRRRLARRRRRFRRAAAGIVLVSVGGGFAFGAHELRGRAGRGTAAALVRPVATKPAAAGPGSLPAEIRGVHVTMALASIPGRLDSYLALERAGLNTIELDVKDENGDVGFMPSAVPLARATGAAKPYYAPRAVARKVHAAGLYLIGRIVAFEDPVLSSQRPQLALHTPDGGLWRNHAGLGWVNPYDERVWAYLVHLGQAAARAGFDEIQYDYVRFPSDGDVDSIVYPVKRNTPMSWVIARFVHYASKRLEPLGVRVSVDVFGLAATRELGIGQNPKRLAHYVDAVYPMVYPSHFGAGEYGLEDPNAKPGLTVDAALGDFQRQLRGTDAVLVPWLQDFSLGRSYSADDVRLQIEAARARGAAGFLLWNPLGVYTADALAAP